MAVRSLASCACRPPVAVQALGPLAFAAVRMRRPFAVPARTPWCDVPAFFKRLAGVNSNPVDARALAFTILTGLRTSEVIGADEKAPATWGEIGEEEFALRKLIQYRRSQ